MLRPLLLAVVFPAFLTAQTESPPTPSASPKPATVSGRVTVVSGQPLKKVNVTLRPASPGPNGQMASPYATTSGPDGKFSFDAVEPGGYRLSANHPAYQSMNYGAKKPRTIGMLLTVSAGQTLGALDMVLSPQLFISGKVLDADGDPVAHAQLRAYQPTFYGGKRQVMSTGFANTDENGDYKISNLITGKYYVSAEMPFQFSYENTRTAAAPTVSETLAKPEEGPAPTFYPGTTDFTAAQLIEVSPDHDRPGTNITIRRVPVYRITGSIAGPLPQDRRQLHVSLMTEMQMGGMGGSPVAEKDNTFTLRGVPGGSYIATVATTNSFSKILGTAKVQVRDRDVSGLVIQVAAPFDLSGKVILEPDLSNKNDQSKKPPSLSGVGLTLTWLDGPAYNPPNGKSADDGSFTLTGVVPGQYRVNAYQFPEGYYLKSIRYGEQDAMPKGFSAQPGTTQLEILLSPQAAKLQGTVQTADGKPAAGALVTLVPDPMVPERTDLTRTTSTDQNGVFTITGIPPGKYRAYAWTSLENGIQFDPDFLKPYETRSAKQDLAASGSGQIALTVLN